MRSNALQACLVPVNSYFGLFYVAMVFQEASDCHLVSDSVWVVCLHHLKKCEVVLFVIMNTSKAGVLKVLEESLVYTSDPHQVH